MYEKLAKRLRERAAWINFPHHGEEYPTEDAKLMMDAADAIEELQAQNNELLFRCAQDEKLIDFIYQTGKLPRNEPPKPR